MLPQKTNRSVEMNAEELLREVLSETFVVKPDELAYLLIQQDPSIQLIDVRGKEDYEAYSLPGAINIPFDSLMTENWGGYLDQDVKKNVLFSTGTTLSSRAWMLLKQRGYRQNYFLDGGLNAWFSTIIEPPVPPASASAEVQERFQTRRAASQFFTGKTGTPPPQNQGGPLIPIQRKKKGMVKGGCS
jgi:rhodanese-related sulfurtransferase